MPLSGDVFMRNIRGFRIVWLAGRPGGGKTAFAVRLAYEIWRRKWCKYIVGNFPCVLCSDLDKVPEVRDTCIILDEAGIFLKDQQFDDLTAFVRKRNLYLIMSSVQDVPMDAKALNVERSFDGYSVGLPLWQYSTMLQMKRRKEKATISWWNPKEVFGLYDTEYEVADDYGIVEWVKAGYGETLARKGRVSFRDGDSGVDELRRVAKAFHEGAAEISEAVSLARTKTRRR